MKILDSFIEFCEKNELSVFQVLYYMHRNNSNTVKSEPYLHQPELEYYPTKDELTMHGEAGVVATDGTGRIATRVMGMIFIRSSDSKRPYFCKKMPSGHDWVPCRSKASIYSDKVQGLLAVFFDCQESVSLVIGEELEATFRPVGGTHSKAPEKDPTNLQLLEKQVKAVEYAADISRRYLNIANSRR